MVPFWNIRDVRPPPNLTYEVKLSHIDADEFSSVCADAIKILNEQETLHLEAATLSRLLYRMKSKMRCDKGFKFMTKVNRCLLRYLSMDMAVVFNTIKPSPSDNGYRTVCAPSRQMLEWVLVRTQGFARLFSQVIQLCQETGFYLKCRLRLGHVFDFALISLGIVSRIWLISKYLVLCACEWYKRLKLYLDVLKPVGIRWLPADYQFPTDLKEWINAALLTDPVEIKRSENRQKKQHKIFDLVELCSSDDEELEESSYNDEVEVLNLNEAITMKPSAKGNEKESTLSKQRKHPENEKDLNCNLTSGFAPPRKELISLVEDIGEPVSSSVLSPWLSTPPLSRKNLVEPKKKEECTKHKVQQSVDQRIKSIKTAHDLEKFLGKENKFRNKGSSASLTGRLDKLQWHMLQKVLSEFVGKLNSKSVMEGSDKYMQIMRRARKEISMRTR